LVRRPANTAETATGGGGSEAGRQKHAYAREEQDGRNQIDRDIFDPAVQLRLVAAKHEQSERGDQHDLEPDIEVEQVAGHERTAHAGEQRLEQRMVAEHFASTVNIGHAEYGDRQSGDGGDDDHDGTKEIGGQCDAEGCRPAADLRRNDTVVPDLDHQNRRDGEQHRAAGSAQLPRDAPVAAQREDGDRGCDRHEDR